MTVRLQNPVEKRRDGFSLISDVVLYKIVNKIFVLMKTNIGILGLLIGLTVSCYGSRISYMDNNVMLEDDVHWQLRTAAQEGNTTEVERLIRKEGANVDMRDYTKEYTPLHWAVENSHEAAAMVLLRNGAPVDAPSKLGDTPLHRAAALGRVPIAKLLVGVYKADVNRETNDGVTAIELAVSIDNLPLVKYLCKKGAKVNNIDEDQGTLLHYVKSKAVLECILEHGLNTKELLNKQNFSGCTPLSCAAYKGNEEVAKMLLDLGADPTIVGYKGMTALDEANRKEHTAIAAAIQAKLQANGHKRNSCNTSIGMTTRAMKRKRASLCSNSR